MIYAASEASVPEPADRADVRIAYEEVTAAAARRAGVEVPAASPSTDSPAPEPQ
jgi:hypothetical protein